MKGGDEMRIQTQRLRLEPDKELPELKRLRFSPTDVTVEDIFLKGIHPHSVVRVGNQHDYTGMADTILAKLNEPTAYLAELKAHNLGYEIATPGYSMYGCSETPDPVDRLLKYLSENIYFTDDLAYEQLLAMAIARLRRIWDGGVARNMLNNLARDFASMREMVKSKNPDIKVASYAELDDIDVSRLFTVDDFITEEQLLLSFGLESRNFRRADALKAFTDDEGRLKATSSISHCQVSWGYDRIGEMPLLTYQCALTGRQIRWKPSMADNPKEQEKTRQVARVWGKGSGRYCFTSDLADMDRMIKQLQMRLSFPDLKYGGGEKSESEASAQVRQKAVMAYDAPFRVKADSSNETIKDLLRRFDWKLTGRKEDLVQRLAELMAEQYAIKAPELDEFFSNRRFIRLMHERTDSKRLQVLQGYPLAGHLLTMYCVRHMRGNVLLEAQHENTAVGLLDLAEAILMGRVRLSGCFVPVQ
jgi:hypothetical protein